MEQFSLVHPLGWNFELEVPSRNINWYVSGYEKFTANIFAQFCRDSDVIIDIGAHVGFYSLIAAQANPEARIIAIEPSPVNVEVLEKNLTLNASKVEVIQKVFSSENGRVNFDIAEASDNSCVGESPASPTIKVIQIDTITGEELLLDLESRITLKIDIEGFELNALQSLERIMQSGTEVKLFLEFNPSCLVRSGVTSQELFEKLNDFGFRVFALSDEYCRWTEVIFPRIPDDNILNKMGYVNLVCVKSKLTVGGVLHSGALYGGERDYLELASALISEGHLVHSVLPALDQGLAEKLMAVGSSVSLAGSINWWVDGDLEPDANNLSPLFWSKYVSDETISVIQSVSPDVVVSSSLVIPQGAITATALNLPHIWWIQEFGDLDHGMQLPVERQGFGELISKLSDSVITVSESVRGHFFPEQNGLATVVYPQPQIDFALNSINSKSMNFRFAIIGSFQEGKGHEDLFGAMSHLTGHFGKFEVVFYGTGRESDVQRLRAKLNLSEGENHVKIKSFVKDRGEIFSNIDAVLITSRNEAFGRVPIEAIQSGIAVIYADSAGPREYMTDGVNGLAYSPGDSVSLARAMALLMDDPILTKSLIKNGHQVIEKLSRKGTVAKQFIRSLEHSSAKPDLRLQNSILLGIKLAERDSAVAERDSAVAERDSAVAERDSAVAERDKILNSTIWKTFQPYRKFRQFFHGQ
jgi:FkbM family methyltransferase